MRPFTLLLIGILTLALCSCEGCSKSGRHHQRLQRQNKQEGSRIRSGKLTIPMKEKNGVYEIPVLINGSNMNFIFDTGASDITISAVEAMFLIKQGTLSEEDIIGVEQYQIADGSISEGTVINLKSIQLGDKKIYNVKASVVNNINAPLLFGQSALSQFGRVSIDYHNNLIIFE